MPVTRRQSGRFMPEGSAHRDRRPLPTCKREDLSECDRKSNVILAEHGFGSKKVCVPLPDRRAAAQAPVDNRIGGAEPPED